MSKFHISQNIEKWVRFNIEKKVPEEKKKFSIKNIPDFQKTTQPPWYSIKIHNFFLNVNVIILEKMVNFN